jgi:hypothetical protein
VSTGRRACDANITVKVGTTSCAFGENVFYGFWKAQDQGDDAFEAYSPVNKRSYAMDCTAGTAVVCRAGDGGEVRFTRAAVDAYNADQAARYAATHDVGPMDDETRLHRTRAKAEVPSVATATQATRAPAWTPTRWTTTARAAAATGPSTPAQLSSATTTTASTATATGPPVTREQMPFRFYRRK